MNRAGLLPLLLTVAVCSGCTFSRRDGAQPPEATAIASPASVSVTQKGDAAVPAEAKTETQKTTILIPEGSVLVFFDAQLGRIELKLSKDTPVTIETQRTEVSGPVAFVPPAPPTPKEEAAGKAEFWITLGMWAGLVVGGFGAIFGLVRGWDWLMGGGIALAGGAVLGLFLKAHPVLCALLIGGGLVAGFAGPWFWHRHVKHSQPSSAA